jgi:riboflavin synthase
MFTGIIESLGTVQSAVRNEKNITFSVGVKWANDLAVGESVSHDGVCLTVENAGNGEYTVTAIDETLARTTLKNWKVPYQVNLERSLPVNSRLHGHMVQGHVDDTLLLKKIREKKENRLLTFEFNKKSRPLVVEKGSVCVNGISLTVAELRKTEFVVAVIPHTWTATNLQFLKKGEEVNVEWDIIGKYVAQILNR